MLYEAARSPQQTKVSLRVGTGGRGRQCGEDRIECQVTCGVLTHCANAARLAKRVQCSRYVSFCRARAFHVSIGSDIPSQRVVLDL